VVAKVELHAGELFPRVGFMVTNLETGSRAVVRFYSLGHRQFSALGALAGGAVGSSG